MDFIINQALEWVEAHLGILAMGLLGAVLAFLLDQETLRNKLVGFIVGLIMCIALSDGSADLFAHGKHPEVFGFLWGAIGKSTAEILLTRFRAKAVDVIPDKVE